MGLLEAVVLGFVQGLTEFLPISSSGHLVLVQSLFSGISESGLVFDVFLHGGTLLAVIIYFRQDLLDLLLAGINRTRSNQSKSLAEMRFLLLGLIVASIPAALAGFFLESQIEVFFSSQSLVAVMLCVTGIMLIGAEMLARRDRPGTNPNDGLRWWEWIIVGCAQSLALLPGISRSGSTIAAGMTVGWSRVQSARFSFLLMIPAVSGALLMKTVQIVTGGNPVALPWMTIMIGMAVAAVSGYAAIDVLLKYIRTRRLLPFGIYCILIGLLILLKNL
jgi:undecaprenyl-diphosphatase